jgi:polysaccharide pyruvyl transferase WcaK-like protein
VREVSIIGATIYGNRGAEAMLSTVIGRFKEYESNTTFNVYTYYPDEDKKLCKTKNINLFSADPLCLLFVLFPSACLLRLLKAIRSEILAKMILPESIIALSRSDVLIDIAGVSFMDGRVKFIPYNVLTIIIAMIVKTPVVKFAQAMGTFYNPLVYLSARMVLPKCTKIFTRGKETENNLKILKLHDNILDNAADVVFLHKEEYSLSNENHEYANILVNQMKKVKKKGQKIIGICPSSVMALKANSAKWNYYHFVGECVYRLSKKGYAVLLFPNATREQSAKLRNNDLPVIEKTVRYLAAFHKYPEDLLFVKKDINTACIKKLVDYCDVVLVSRFHAMIVSLSMLKPLVVIGWSHKYMEVMHQFGLEEYVFDYKNNSVGLLLDKVENACENKSNIKSIIKNSLTIVKEDASKQFEYILSMLGK